MYLFNPEYGLGWKNHLISGVIKVFFICIVFLYFSVSTLCAQLVPNTDSLKSQLQGTQGEHRIEVLWDLSEHIQRSNIDSAITYAREALQNAQLHTRKNMRAESHRRLGRLLSMNGEHPEGLQHLLAAKRIYKQLGGPQREAATLENIGALYRRQSDYPKALEYYYNALELREKLADQKQLINTLKNIGVINERLGQKEKAIHFYKRTLSISEEYDNASETAINAVQLGNIYASLGETDQALQFMNTALEASRQLPGEHASATILLEISDLYKNAKSYQQALEANQEALSLATGMAGKSLQALAMKNIAVIYAEQGELSTANSYLMQTLDLFREIGRLEEVVKAQIQIARNYLEEEEPTQSIAVASKALDTAEEVQSFELSRQVLEVLIEAYREKREFEQALIAQEQMIAVRDSIFNQTKSRQIAEMQTRYETKKKEQEIALLQKEKKQQALLRNAFLVGLILIGIIGILVYNRQRIKINKNRTQLENKRLKEEQLEQELDFKNKQLTTHTLHLVQKNETMKELKEKINEMRHKENGNVNKSLQKLRNLVDYSFSLDEDWEQFRLYFEEVHDHFFDTLKKKYPELTPNELRLSALAKLNLSIKETATIMGITPNSVKTARYRLRKKLDIETEENLTEFMMEIEKEGKELS
ncbi:hypothetical protein CK503_02255 [Aliifodinibius salipaludis]|uniref:HTH luxR-type domain-containing protein n=1 Tax=Fodinibius salipaludis TaxID=2032627 RepID=A0A2A2GEW0_9BACT|nr:tetratricopeptide repeat protein [Aliifodinibius salipaludis]PAU95898.1 hypothetical protein CK503_02255 [Aliifodinibius salipaludis]